MKKFGRPSSDHLFAGKRFLLQYIDLFALWASGYRKEKNPGSEQPDMATSFKEAGGVLQQKWTTNDARITRL
jgi:hypothetical protein